MFKLENKKENSKNLLFRLNEIEGNIFIEVKPENIKCNWVQILKISKRGNLQRLFIPESIVDEFANYGLTLTKFWDSTEYKGAYINQMGEF